jgi:uncharacterized membrane protein
MNIDGREVLLCPRCIGLHLGFLFSYIVIAFKTGSRIIVVERSTKVILALAIGSMAVDWGIGGYLGLFRPTSFSRLATGLATGSALSVLVISYRQGMVCILKDSIINLTGFQMVCLICFSFCVTVAVVFLSSWSFLSSILLLSVIANASLAIHTISFILKKRLLNREAGKRLSSNKGG